MRSNNVGCGTVIKRWLVFGGVIVVFIILAANTGKDKAPAPPASSVSQSETVAVVMPQPLETPQPTATEGPMATEGPTATPYPTPIPTNTPLAQTRLQNAFTKALSPTNRKGVLRVSVVVTTYDPPDIVVVWAINDNLTEGLIKGSAKHDIVLMLKALDDSGIPFATVRFSGSFSLADQFGNASEETVVKAVYKRDTVQRINWNGFLNDNVYAIADTLSLHRLFQE